MRTMKARALMARRWRVRTAGMCVGTRADARGRALHTLDLVVLRVQRHVTEPLHHEKESWLSAELQLGATWRRVATRSVRGTRLYGH